MKPRKDWQIHPRPDRRIPDSPSKKKRRERGNLKPLQGEDHYAAKLTHVQVREIRASDEKPSALARKYKVNLKTIRNAQTGKHYRKA